MSDTYLRDNELRVRGFRSTNVTSSRAVKNEPGSVRRVLVNSHTSGTFKFFDGTAYGSRAIGGTYTPAAGSSQIEIEAAFDTAIFMGVGGTADYTVIYE